MKYTPLMPLLIAAAFYIPRAHAAEQPDAHVFRATRSIVALSRVSTAQAIPAAPGYTLLLTGLGLLLLATRRPQNDTFTDPA